MQQAMEKNIVQSEFLPIIKLQEGISPRFLIVDDDITSEAIWEVIIRGVHPRATMDWAIGYSDACEKIRNSRVTGRPFNAVIVDIFLSGSKTGLDLWNDFNGILDQRMIIISSIEPAKLKSYLSKSDHSPMYLKKPIVPGECRMLLQSFL